MSKILVSGGAGFIASHLTDKLIEQGHQVIVIDNLSTGKKENLNPKAKFYELDICDSKISQIFKKEKPETIFHFAAQIDIRKSVKDPIEDAKINILGSLNILQNFIIVNQPNQYKSAVPKIIFASSGGAIYGDTDVIPTPENHLENPESPYGIEKLAIEKYLNFYKKTYGLDYVSLRFSNVYGPRQNSKGEAGVIAIFCDKMLRNEKVVINGDGEQTRDFVYVDDVVEAALSAIKKEKSGIYNIGIAKETSINEIFRKIKELTNSDCQEIHGPIKSGEQKRSCLDFSKIKKALNWQPKYSLEKGLKETISWFKKKIKS
ncbi:MAG: NAD-dependent epimerase/dehydratase family protein [Candidatus Nealsonbacteria bacterium]